MRPTEAVPPISAGPHSTHRSPGRRRRVTGRAASVVGALLVALLAATVAGPAAAQTSDQEAERAVREIQAARDRANAAADAFFAAQSELDLLEDEAERLVREIVALERRVTTLRSDVQSLALARFAGSGAEGIPLLTGLQAPKDQVQADVLVTLVTDTGYSALDEFDEAQKELTEKRGEVAAQRAEIEEQQARHAALQEEAEAEVARLREIEEERLTDQAVARALAAQEAASRAELEEATRREAEAEARARPNPGVAAADATSEGSANEGDAAAGGAPIPAVAQNSGPSGGLSGGRTGLNGPGSSPIGVLNGTVYLDSMLCPIAGSAYGDSWGAPRSGGRLHEGVDMLAPRGTPIVAVVDGTVRFYQNRLGGNAVSLVGDNGNRYYYAHLASYEGVSRRVNQGEVIGYNGDTGNATGVPHLHFEIHPGGGLAVNPFPSVQLAGC